MWRSILIISILAGFPGMTLVCQNSAVNKNPDFPLRIEIPAHSVNETYRVIPCGTNGLIMFFRSQEVTENSLTRWYFTCYDTNFQRSWVKSIPLLGDQDFRFSQAGQDTLALLFVHTGKPHAAENSYEIIRIVMKTGTMILNTGTIADGSVVDAFEIRKGRAWLGVNSKGQEGKIVNVELKHGINKSFTLGNGNQISLLWLQADSSSAFVSAIVNRQVSKKNSEYYLARYDTSGLIKNEVLLGSPTADRTLTKVSVAHLPSGGELILGSYGQGAAGSNQKNKQAEVSTGLFACPVKSGTQQPVTFYNFLELQSAGAVVGENDIINLKKKALKKNKSLSEYSLDFSVLMHPVLRLNNQYILITEIFSPEYHTENFTDFDFYGRPYTNSYSVFDGYRFFNAIVAGFDQEGKLLWDNNIEIRNLVSLELSPKVVSFPSGDNLVLCYISDGKIGSKIIRESEVVEKLDFTSLDLLNPDDKLITETKGALVRWYGDYFLSSGYQDIKNIALESNNKRLIFYFSKVRFEN